VVLVKLSAGKVQKQSWEEPFLQKRFEMYKWELRGLSV